MPRRYVLDTHACVFALTAPRKLGVQARKALERVQAGTDLAWVPAAVVAELLILRGLGRVSIGIPELRSAMESVPSFRFAALDFAQLDEFAGLAGIPDPFDRLVVSAARTLDARLITRDGGIVASGLVETIWS